jgi:uncharacterized RDD family membrane protein YckC
MAYCQVCGAQETDGQVVCASCGAPSSSPRVRLSSLTPLPPLATRSFVPPAAQNIAGFWWRFGGFVIDALILGLAISLPLRQSSLSFYTQATIEVVGAFLYFGLFVRHGGATVGMRFCRLRCLSADGSAVTATQAYTRALTYCVFILIGSFYELHSYRNPTPAETRALARQLGIYLLLSAPHYLDLLWAAWDPRRQTIHDKAAGTIVVRVISP